MIYMNNTMKLLNHIYQDAQMGAGSITTVLEHSKDSAFTDDLRTQKGIYDDIRGKAQDMIEGAGGEVKGLNLMEKARTNIMIDMQTLTDESTSHLAEMMIIGTNMGVIELLKKLREYEDGADSQALDLMTSLLDHEENAIKRLKEYL